MCDWEWDDMAMVGVFSEMIADEEMERILAERENEPLSPTQILDEDDIES